MPQRLNHISILGLTLRPRRYSASRPRDDGTARRHFATGLVWLCLSAATVLFAAPRAVIAAPTIDAQRDPDLKNVLSRAIAQAECFTDKYDSAIWYTMMEPRLRRMIKDRAERLELLKNVYCEAHREGEQRLPPGLVMAVIDVESRFDRWAVSSAGAVGLMQVMPFWPEQLGMRRHELTQTSANIKMGCAILRHYLKRERNNVNKALARYNGSVGQRVYSDLVIVRWTKWNGADDLGITRERQTQNVSKPSGS
jgi:soluble lytic murein transglycosylase-like protein